MRNRCFYRQALALLLLFFLSSCQKVVLDEEEHRTTPDQGVMVTFRIASLEQIPFDAVAGSRGTDVSAACSRINLAFYQNSTKVSQINQEISDANYGTLKANLVPGTYKVVLVAHNGNKNATMTNPEKITFDYKVTDTFYFCGDIKVGGDSTCNLQLRRAVAMVRFMTEDPLPASVRTMRFYYTGGSSTFDAVHGVGCVNSKQHEEFDVSPDMVGKPGTFEIFTFPRADSKSLKLQVTALGDEISILKDMTIDEVKIQRNMITQYKGNFFENFSPENNSSRGLTFSLYSDDEWSTSSYNF
jgi:hypothetical protein